VNRIAVAFEELRQRHGREPSNGFARRRTRFKWPPIAIICSKSRGNALGALPKGGNVDEGVVELEKSSKSHDLTT